MTDFERVLSTPQLGPGALAEVEAHGRTIALANIGQQYFAFDGVCPRDGTNLARNGRLDGERLVCPAGHTAYDATDHEGTADSEPDQLLQRYAVRVQDNEILVGPPIED